VSFSLSSSDDNFFSRADPTLAIIRFKGLEKDLGGNYEEKIDKERLERNH
jgi:hypothetical protein